jgi:hypothetical protein
VTTRSFFREGLGVDDLAIIRSIHHDGSKKMIWWLPSCFLEMVSR